MNAKKICHGRTFSVGDVVKSACKGNGEWEGRVTRTEFMHGTWWHVVNGLWWCETTLAKV